MSNYFDPSYFTKKYTLLQQLEYIKKKLNELPIGVITDEEASVDENHNVEFAKDVYADGDLKSGNDVDVGRRLYADIIASKNDGITILNQLNVVNNISVADNIIVQDSTKIVDNDGIPVIVGGSIHRHEVHAYVDGGIELVFTIFNSSSEMILTINDLIQCFNDTTVVYNDLPNNSIGVVFCRNANMGNVILKGLVNSGGAYDAISDTYSLTFIDYDDVVY